MNEIWPSFAVARVHDPLRLLAERNMADVTIRQLGTAQTLSVTTLVQSRHDSKIKKKLNSVVSVRKRTIPTERPQPVGEVSANFS
jgi:hypothetical protein